MRVGVFVGVSIDGFIAREDGSLDFLKPFEGEAHGYEEFMRSVDALVVGRSTYETALGFEAWPWEGKRVVVLTHRPLDARRGETPHEGALAPLLARLAREGLRRIYLDGGAAIRQGIEEDLVDDMTLSTVPVTLGAGRRLFGGAPRMQGWRLVSVREFPSGVVQTLYERKRREA